MNQAVILAAGSGSRLTTASGGAPKCLVEVGGRGRDERVAGFLFEPREDFDVLPLQAYFPPLSDPVSRGSLKHNDCTLQFFLFFFLLQALLG